MPDAVPLDAAPPSPPAAGLWQHWRALSCVVVAGGDRLAHLQRLCSQDLRPLAAAGRAARALCLTAQGRLVDWVQVVARPDALWLATSPGRAAQVAAWIERYTITEDVDVEVREGALCRLLLVGPGAAAAAGLAAAPAPGHALLAPEDLPPPAAAVWQPALAAWGEGLEGWVPHAAAAACRAALARAGAAVASDEALEGRRLAAGIPGPAGEYPGEVNPLELRLTGSSVGWNKGCYIGQEVISRLVTYRKVARLLVGVVARLPVGLTPTAATRLLAGGQPIGRLTSWQAAGGLLTGLALVKAAAALPQPAVLVESGQELPCALTLPPFCAGEERG